MKTTFLIVLLLNAFIVDAQNVFVGTFQGNYNNDNIVLTLQSAGGKALSGKMKDSQQNYEVTATASGIIITGKAVEKSMGLTFALYGTLNNSQLNMKMTLELTGTVLDVVFYKQGSNATTTSKSNVSSKINFPSGATHDRNLVGTWTKNDNYNSGYGDNYMGASFQQSMVFFADGTMADGGSRASMSGSSYSGYSEGGSRATPELYWYNVGNQLYILGNQNGKSETMHLGKFYIENGAMLITGTNGKKLLLTKK